MNDNDALNIMLALNRQKDRRFFMEALKDTKVRTTLDILDDGVQVMKYLYSPGNRLPQIIFLDMEIPVKGAIDYLVEIRTDKRFSDLAVAIYSSTGSEEIIEESFIKGANIYLKKTDDPFLLKNAVSQIITLSWQYHTSGMLSENFLLNVTSW